jgi:hypothetical protein
LHELQERYCLDDIIDMNEALDQQAAAEKRAREEQQAKTKGAP